MKNIVTRLRDATEPRYSSYPVSELLAEAANEIVNLRAELAEARRVIGNMAADIVELRAEQDSLTDRPF